MPADRAEADIAAQRSPRREHIQWLPRFFLILFNAIAALLSGEATPGCIFSSHSKTILPAVSEAP
jgi:hypothetical protein